MEVGHSGGSRPSDKGRGGEGRSWRPWDKRGARFPKKIFSALRASFWSNNNWGEGPPGPSPGYATGVPQIGEVTCRIYVNWKDQFKMRDFMDRRVTEPKRITSATGGPSLPWTQALTDCSQPIYHLKHLVYPPKFCITMIFDFSWDDCNTQESENNGYAKFCKA